MIAVDICWQIDSVADAGDAADLSWNSYRRSRDLGRASLPPRPTFATLPPCGPLWPAA